MYARLPGHSRFAHRRVADTRRPSAQIRLARRRRKKIVTVVGLGDGAPILRLRRASRSWAEGRRVSATRQGAKRLRPGRQAYTLKAEGLGLQCYASGPGLGCKPFTWARCEAGGAVKATALTLRRGLWSKAPRHMLTQTMGSCETSRICVTRCHISSRAGLACLSRSTLSGVGGLLTSSAHLLLRQKQPPTPPGLHTRASCFLATILRAEALLAAATAPIRKSADASLCWWGARR